MNKILIRTAILVVSIIPAYICSYLVQRTLVGYQLEVHPACDLTKFRSGPCTDATGGVTFTLAFPVFLIIFFFLLLFAKNKLLT